MRFFLAIVLLLSGFCAVAEELNDPWENWNRKVFTFNDKIDTWLIRPVAVAYHTVTPEIVDRGVTNAFSNLNELPSSANALLQGKVSRSSTAILRFLINSTIGIFGLFDVATVIGVPVHKEDFAQTLAVWGVPSGNYLVLPFLGPATFRDGAGMIVDIQFSPLNVEHTETKYSLWALRVIDLRADFIKAESLISGDPYIFMRDAWWQQRQFLIHDGKLTDDFDQGEFDDEDDWLE